MAYATLQISRRIEMADLLKLIPRPVRPSSTTLVPVWRESRHEILPWSALHVAAQQPGNSPTAYPLARRHPAFQRRMYFWPRSAPASPMCAATRRCAGWLHHLGSLPTAEPGSAADRQACLGSRAQQFACCRMPGRRITANRCSQRPHYPVSRIKAS